MNDARLTDDELVAVIKGEREMTVAQAKDAAGELHHRRRVGRDYGRRAKEIERLRWMTETLVKKVEHLATTDAALADQENAELNRGLT